MSRIYCYAGECGFTATDLFWTIAIETTLEELGLDDVAAALAIVGGMNIVAPPRGKLAGTTPNTSLLSLHLRRVLKKKRFPGNLRLPTLTGWGPPRVAYTRSVGAFIARAVPVAGWAYTVAEIGTIAYKIVRKYDSLVSAEDRFF
ncbi:MULTISPECIES: STM2901 family protein [Pseudomonas]|uniref:STM2901 family protein n=1 Tax=Pseudomonas TaxID=286 RepID=UPI000B76D8FB|nr:MULTISPECIES: hypothetical protein [Pseudomonas]PWU29454.1 hypothetical protein DK254_15075 [Pseudomonas sp. RW407]